MRSLSPDSVTGTRKGIFQSKISNLGCELSTRIKCCVLRRLDKSEFVVEHVFMKDVVRGLFVSRTPVSTGLRLCCLEGFPMSYE